MNENTRKDSCDLTRGREANQGTLCARGCHPSSSLTYMSKPLSHRFIWKGSCLSKVEAIDWTPRIPSRSSKNWTCQHGILRSWGCYIFVVFRALSWKSRLLRSAFLFPLPSSSLGVTVGVVELVSRWIGAEANVRDRLARRNRECGGEQKIFYIDGIGWRYLYL